MRLFLTLMVLLFATMFWIDKKAVYKLVYMILSLILITIIFIFFIMFTSSFEVSPWHESTAFQFLVPIYLSIWLWIIGGLFMLLSLKLTIPNIMQYLPFIAGIAFGAIVLYEEPDNLYLQISGAILSIFFFGYIIALFSLNFEQTFLAKNK